MSYEDRIDNEPVLYAPISQSAVYFHCIENSSRGAISTAPPMFLFGVSEVFCLHFAHCKVM